MDQLGTVRGEPADLLFEQAARSIHEILQQSGWKRWLGIGEVVLRTFFEMDAERWISRRDRQHSLRKLAARPDCPLGKTALADAVWVYLVHRDCPALSSHEHLTPSHVATVAKLDSATRSQLLERAAEEHWSVRELRAIVRQVRRDAGERRGRPLSPPECRALTCVRQALATLQRSHELLSCAEQLSHEARVELNSYERAFDATLVEMRKLLRAHRNELDSSVGIIVPLAKARAGAPNEQPQLASG